MLPEKCVPVYKNFPGIAELLMYGGYYTSVGIQCNYCNMVLDVIGAFAFTVLAEYSKGPRKKNLPSF